MKIKDIISGIFVGLFLAIIGFSIYYFVSENLQVSKKGNDKLNTINIDFDTNGGEAINNVRIIKNEGTDLPNAYREGYIFDGWYLNGKRVYDGYVFTKDVTLEARWTKVEEGVKTFVVSFNSNGGTRISPVTVICNNPLYLPSNPTRTGYNFVSWKDSNGNVISNGSKLACENITLNAAWSKKESAVTPTNPVTPSTPSDDNTDDNKPVTPTISYKCPDEYILQGEKCYIEEEATYACPNNTVTYGIACLNLSKSYQPTYFEKNACPEEIIVTRRSTQNARLEKGKLSSNKCVYHKYDEFTDEKSCLKAADYYTTWFDGACYAKVTEPLDPICPTGSIYASSASIVGACYKTVDATKTCKDGYKLTNNKCVKTIDAEKVTN